MTKVCDICQISFSKEHSFKGHLSGKSHIMKILTEQIEVNSEFSYLLPFLEKSTSFENQLKTFLLIVGPHVDVDACCKKICSHLKKLFRPSFPECTLQQIGSTLTGLCLKTDHLKIYINSGKSVGSNEDDVSSDDTFKKFFSKAKNLITPRFSDVKLFSKVPKIKFVDNKTKISCELHFSNGLSVYNSHLAKHYISMDPRLKPLMMIIKYWTRVCGFSTEYIFTVKSSGLYITTYALVMLFIFYLQQPNVDLVPPVMTLQENCDTEIVDGWQVNFNERIQHPSDDSKSIPELLHGFFDFYANFDFEHLVICPIDGCAHPKQVFNNVDNLPDSMDRYKKCTKNTKNASLLDIEKSLCIQDPIELNRNCSYFLSNQFVKSFQEHVSIAAQICVESLCSDSSHLLLNLFKRRPEKKIIPDPSFTVKADSIESKIKSVKNCKIKYRNLKRNLQQSMNFENQLALFSSQVSLRENLIESLYEPVCEQLNQLFRKSFPVCQVRQIGSTVTGLCFKKSHLDVYLSLVEPIISNRKSTLPSVLTFRKISALVLMQLLDNSQCYRKITSVLKGKMPIIKFTDKKTKISCELSFKNSLGVHNSLLIKHYLSYDTRIKPLIMIIKFWAERCGFKTAKITNYALVLLCIFYLQQPDVNLVPPVINLKRHCDPEIIDGWQVNFNEKIQYPRVSDNSIPELLHGFFHFYADFDFEKFVICPIDGCAHPKKLFKNINILPESMNRYVEYMNNTENAIPLKVEATICLQDPTELNVNCTFNAPDYFLNVFRKLVYIAAKVCATALESDCSNLLLNLFETVNAATKKETRKIARKGDSDSSSSSSSSSDNSSS